MRQIPDEVTKLIREDDEVVYGDSGYTGIEKREEITDDDHPSGIDYRIAKRPSSQKTTDAFQGFNREKEIEHRKASVRCQVEHAFLIVKRDFGCRNVVYKGIKKNLHRFHMLFACANLPMYIRSGHTESLNAA